MSWASGAEQGQNVVLSQRQEAGSFLNPFTPILTRCLLGVGMAAYTRKSGGRRCPLCGRQSTSSRGKKFLCWERKGHWEQVEEQWGVLRTQDFPADEEGLGDNQAACH